MRLQRIMFKFFIGLPTIALLTIMCVTVANVIGRTLLESPILGAIEIAGLCGAITVAFSLVNAQIEDRNVTTSIVFDLLPKRVQNILEKITLILSLVIVGALTYSTALSVHEAIQETEVSFILTIYIWPFKLIWSISCLLFCAVLVSQFFNILSGAKSK